jgi:4-oxalocrotonate tautomerase
MPFVHVQTYSGRTLEQKTACAKAIVEAVHKHLGLPPDVVQVLFSDVEKADWFNGDRLGVLAPRAAPAAAPAPAPAAAPRAAPVPAGMKK